MISKWIVGLNVAALGSLLILVPVTASAQQASGIAGVVRDTSGGALPGVTGGTRFQMSSTMSEAGRAQQMSTWPSAGSSSGSGA